MSSLTHIHKTLIERGQTLSCAESCTGGLLASMITSQAGASRYFLGGVVSYHGSVKENLLQVPKSLIQAHGEVSVPVALAMAQGARATIKSDWAMAVTGIAGPAGGTTQKPVGYVCFAVVGPGSDSTDVQSFGSLDRVHIQKLSAEHALMLLEKAVLRLQKELK